jgi:single-stranded DNA-binding protein
MAFNLYSGYGRIVSVSSGSSGEGDNANYYLRVTVNVYTGERKKEDDEYAPSVLMQFTLWNKRAQGLEPYLEQGKNIIFSGKLGVPNTYLTEDGEPRVSLRLHMVDDVTLTDRKEDSAKVEEEEKPAAKSSSKTSTKAKAKADEDDDFPF